MSQLDALDNYHITPTTFQLTLRDLVILTVGLAGPYFSSQELYGLARTLQIRIRSRMAFEITDKERFMALLSKFFKKGLIKQEYSLLQNKYVVTLTELGEGEYDFLLQSLLHNDFGPILHNFKELIGKIKQF